MMKNSDKYIFLLILIACMVMILSCRDNNTNRYESDGASQKETFTNEGTISSGTKDTMNKPGTTVGPTQRDSAALEEGTRRSD
ncbi:hypothetical protein [Flavobacterium lindanitolerans]|uniref:hypothetical protein n=2 Tax=Flavobacterium TaxID=237 RepID=UPI001218B783|nr:hypothetical protein [Flavobacterium lindanitolerans]MDQ7962394.1 hypothetical protein [Flavobacterium lindanitolerans]THD31841.1 MAG: hypothetical protein DI588_09555 [Flavobacterium johnsoniae]